ncbi:hypothetical protein C7271_05680, partial [filamentous cyanobacterium CCP5]
LYYGSSSVFLEANQVVSYFNLEDNLRVSMRPGLPLQSQQDAWTLGSSRAEVLSVQPQTPTHVSRNDGLCEEIYYFDRSEVVFHQGLVSGYEQVDNNLRLR